MTRIPYGLRQCGVFLQCSVRLRLNRRTPACGVLAIIAAQQFVQPRMPAAHLRRPIEKALCRNGKKLAFIPGAILIEQRSLASLGGGNEAIKFPGHYSLPLLA